MRVSKEVIEFKTARVMDLIKGLTDQKRFDNLELKMLYGNKYGERVGDTAIGLAIESCLEEEGTCYVNNTRSWRRGVKPEPVATQPPLFEDDPMGLEATKAEVKRISTLCDSMAMNLIALQKQGDKIEGLVQHIVNELDGVKS